MTVSNGTTTGVVSAIPSRLDTQQYCISAVDAGHWAHEQGPGGLIVNDVNATSNPCANF